jgi:outer membrane immunogenic protein
MKYALTALALVLAAPAYAADMPAKAAGMNAYAAVTPDGWSGLYIGIQGGYGSAKVEQGGYTYFDQSNWLAGGHVGYNYRMGNVVIGVETDAMLGGWKELGWIGSTALRGGVLLTEHLLAYGAAGIVYGRLDTTLYDTSFTGWRAGGGLEYNLTKHLSVRGEYRYMDLAVNSFFPHAKVHAGLAGISLKF